LDYKREYSLDKQVSTEVRHRVILVDIKQSWRIIFKVETEHCSQDGQPSEPLHREFDLLVVLFLANG